MALPLRYLELSRCGVRVVTIYPGHPEYESLLARERRAQALLDYLDFTKCLQGWLEAALRGPR